MLVSFLARNASQRPNPHTTPGVSTTFSAFGTMVGPWTRTSFHLLPWYISKRVAKILRNLTIFYGFLTVFDRNRKIPQQRKIENGLPLA